MKRPLLSAAAIVAAGALMSLNVLPGYAATTVSQASATALRVAIAGNGTDSGTVTATNDGSGETKTGDSDPPIDVLNNQGLLNIGALAQDATARLHGRDGLSAACSGVAGPGGSVAAIGDSSCIVPGDAIGLSIANLDLTGVQLVDPASALAPLEALQPLIDDLVGPLTAQVTQALAPLGEIAIGGTIETIEARCQARPGTASGTAHIANGRLGITAGGQSLSVLELPVEPPPNTHLLTDLSKVLDAVIKGLETQLTTALDGGLGGLVTVTDAIQAQIIDNVVAQIEPQLAPLEENILDLTLNKQVPHPATDRISVTAIDLQVLPAAKQFIGSSLVGAEIANVTCGPNGRVGAPPEDKPDQPKVPTVIDAGADGAAPAATTEDGGSWTTFAASLLVLAGVAGMLGYRRRLFGR